ncbi:MAG: UvrD-helicase domain-containing protein [Paludibacteraceae bacterium]|nr:UvrD-helicase domain-containing protein [Paludibacteraceae bacterium]
MNGVLNIYKASAGSGKTYTLTEQYIKMLLDARSHGRDYFRRVLAVTFTNKATDEMKSRIVKKLYEISKEKEPVSVAGINLEPDRAKELLTTILHNYSFFRITTIDKFFQQIIRSFVKEIGLNGNYTIELDEKRIIKDTIADILLNIGDKERKLFLEWFSEHIIADSGESESKDFNSLKSKLEELSSQIFKEQYMALKGEMPDGKAISDVQKELTARRRAISEALTQKAEAILQRLKSEPVVEENSKRGAFTPIVKFLTDKKVKYPELTATFLNGWMSRRFQRQTNTRRR